ncbi:MAG: hypothetical protein IJA25_02630 [Anaerotignum sp.]|nr:hypothetical protein [Anaerotignum sp.]
MQKSAKFIVIKGVVTMVVVALAGFILFNGIGRHPYAPDELESVFKAKAAEYNVKANGAEQLVSEEYGNSITFVMQAEDGERAVATYGRSPFFNKYKEIQFYSGANGVLSLDEMTYTVSDGVIIYDVTARFGDEVGLDLSDEVKPVMYIKFMAVCILAMGVFGIRLFLSKWNRR